MRGSCLEYDWVKDSKDCWALALRLIALRRGSILFRDIPEMYWQEAHGVIP